MAIYKPNNFYPHLQEIDLTQENTFSCQVNTDGAMVSAARLTISSEDNILVYENLYQFVDINGNKDPIENKGFMELEMDPYKIDNANISFGLIDDSLEPVYYKYAINDNGKVIYYDEYGENGKKIGFSTREEAMAAQVYDEDGMTILYNQDVEDGMLNNYNRKVVVINNIDFITLHPELSYDVRKDYCPYNFYNVKLKDSFCFGLKFVNSLDDNDVFLYPFKYLDYEKTDNGYNMKITYNTELLFDDMSKYDCYIVLLNDKDYTWDVKMYEHLFSEPIDKGTLVTDGYVTGSTKTVFWWDANKQTEDTLLNRKEIKEDYYVEINATEDNSDIFKEQLKLGRTTKGTLSIDKNFIYYRYAINDNNKKIYYDEYGENGKKIKFNTETEAEAVKEIYDEDASTILDNVITEKKNIDDISNKELLNNTNIDGKVSNDFIVENVDINGVKLSTSAIGALMPSNTYYYSETGQRLLKENTVSWKFSNFSLLQTSMNYSNASNNYLNVVYNDDYYFFYGDQWMGDARESDTTKYEYQKNLKSFYATGRYWEVIGGLNISVTKDINGNKQFSIDDENAFRNGSVGRYIRNGYGTGEGENVAPNTANSIAYLSWKNYWSDGVKSPDGLSRSGSYISCIYLDQDFYRYPFLFTTAETKVVGFQKTILTNFLDACTEGSEAYSKISDVIDFYEKKYLKINVDGIPYYVKVFTPRPYSPYFYKVDRQYFGQRNYKNSRCFMYVLDDCMKYPTIYDETDGFLRDTDTYPKPIYPSTEIGQIVAPVDDFSFSDNSECITMSDDIAAFENPGDYATALCVPNYLQVDSGKMFAYFNAVYPPEKIFDSSDNKGVLRYKIVSRGTTSNAMVNTLYQKVAVKSGSKYKVSGILYISGLDLDQKGFSKHVDMFTYRIYEKSNSSLYTDFKNIETISNHNKYIVEEKRYYDFSFDITIPVTYDEPILNLQIAMRTSDDIDDINIRSVDIYNLSLVEVENDNEVQLLLDERTVDINSYEENIFIHTIVTGDTIGGDYEKIIGEHDFKLKKYVKSSNSFEFEDPKIQELFISLLEEVESVNIEYYIFYKQREKVTWVTEKLGFNKNINKIEVENDFDVNLKDESIINLYGGNNKNTYYSFFGVRDSDINVEDIFVRFPGYQGMDFNGDYVNDILPYYKQIGTATKIYNNGASFPLELSSNEGLKGRFYQYGQYYVGNTLYNWDTCNDDNSNVFQPISLYGKNVLNDAFEKNDEKIVAYDEQFDLKKENTINNFTKITIDHYGEYGKNYGFYWSIFVYEKNANNVISLVYNTNISYYGYYSSSSSFQLFLTEDGWKTTDGTIISKDIFQIKIDTNGANITENNYGYVRFGQQNIKLDSTSYYLYPKIVKIPSSYCKLFKVTSYDYETGEFVIAGGLEREILNTDRYEVWQRTVNESMTNEYNITEVAYQYTRLYPPSENYKDVAYVGDTKILKDGIKIMNNTNSRVFIQPNVNFYPDEYNYPYLYLDNHAQRLEFPYNYMVYDDGFTIEDRTIETLDGSQWLLSYNTTSEIDITPGLTYKLYMDTCKSTPSNWFYGRNIANITMRVGEYNYIQEQLDKGYVRPVDFIDFKKTFNDITNKKIGNNCLIQCVDAYFMATYDQLSIPIKRYRYKLYDSSMNLINDSGYIYDNYISYGVRGLRNEEIYLLHFEMEDQLGYVYHYEEKIIVKYIEYNTNIIQLQLTNKDSQGCVVGDFVTLVEAKSDFITDRDTYDEDGNIIKNGTLIKQGMVYAKLCTQDDFVNNLNCSILDDVFVYRRNKEKLLSFVCKINLSKDQIITGRDESDHRYGFIDYGVYNNEYYDYVVILKQKDLTTDSHLGNMEYTYSESRCKTSFNGWILVDIEKDDASNSYYVSDQVWNFKYNLESQDLTQNTSVSKWDTLGKYANVYIGQKNYISSGLTCLLGDVGTYYTYNGDTFKENFGYFEQPYESVNYDDIHNIISNEILTNNIDKYLSWKTFNNNGNPKLLKDYKGNMWIVQIMENPTVKNADNSQEQVYTISFNWVEIMDWRKYPILGKNISFDREEAANVEIMDILQPWDYSYNSGDMFYVLNKVQDDWAYNNVMSYSSPLMVSGRITLEANSMTGILNDSYLGNSVLEDNKEFLSSMSNEEVELLYNNKGAFMSPFKTKQLNDTYDYSSNLTYLDFEQSLLYENDSIDFVCCGMKSLNGININLTDAIKTARYAFAGTSINTDEQYQIIINTNNYINTYGMLDDLQGNGIVTIKWGTLAEDPDLMTYAELYERYWTNDNIILDCKLNFNINDWVIETIIDENGNIDGISYTNKIILKSYEGTLTSVYIPKFYKDGNGEIYLIELSEDFNI